MINDFTSLNAMRCYFVEITDVKDGFLISCKLPTGENDFKSFDEIPVLQSQWSSPIVQKGDYGLLLDIKNNLDAYLQEVQNDSQYGSLNQSYFVFLPIITKSQFNSSADKLSIFSADKQSKFELSNDETSLTAKSFKLTAQSPISAGTDAGTLKDAFSAVFDAIDALKNAAVVSGSATLSWLPSYDTTKATAKSKVESIVG